MSNRHQERKIVGTKTRHPLTVNNKVSPAQLALKPGAHVKVTRDDGSVESRMVKSAPWQMGHGTWVVGISGIAGGYALCRVQPYDDCDEPQIDG